jgi:hypothetical protein
MKVSLRPARPDDLPLIAAVNVAAAQAAFRNIGPVDALEPSVEEWAPRLEAAQTATVAERDGDVVGFAFSGGPSGSTRPRGGGRTAR